MYKYKNMTYIIEFTKLDSEYINIIISMQTYIKIS